MVRQEGRVDIIIESFSIGELVSSLATKRTRLGRIFNSARNLDQIQRHRHSGTDGCLVPRDVGNINLDREVTEDKFSTPRVQRHSSSFVIALEFVAPKIFTCSVVTRGLP